MWANRYDRASEIFALQDEITLMLATEMQVHLTEGEQARLRYTTTNNVEAWNWWVQGLAHFRGAVNRDNLTQARKAWEHALVLDPGSAPLNAALAFIHASDARFGWWDGREIALQKGEAYVERALAIDRENPDVHTSLSLLLLYRRRYDEAVAEARKAVDLGSGSADVAAFASGCSRNVRLPAGCASANRASDQAETQNVRQPTWDIWGMHIGWSAGTRTQSLHSRPMASAARGRARGPGALLRAAGEERRSPAQLLRGSSPRTRSSRSQAGGRRSSGATWRNSKPTLPR